MSDQTALELEPPPPLPERKVEFLTGILATWVAAGDRPTKDERERADRAARAALRELVTPA